MTLRFSKRLHSWREDRGLTQGQLAIKLGIKIRKVQRWESKSEDRLPPTHDESIRLADALDVPLSIVWGHAAADRLRAHDPHMYTWHLNECEHARRAGPSVSEVPVGGITFDLDQLYRLVAGIQRAHENLDLAGALLRLVSLANRVTLTGDLNAQTQNDPATHPFGVWSDLARYLAWFLNAPPTVQAEVVRHIGSTMDLARRASTATWPDTGAEE